MGKPAIKVAAQQIHLSIVAPAYNEQEGIESVVRRWLRFCDELSEASEIIIVNDGSTDKTRKILENLALEHPRLRVISYEPNAGYGAALSNAIAYSRGKWILTIDSDGQFDIEDYYVLWKAVESSRAGCAAGIRRKEDSPIRVMADLVLRWYGKLLFGRTAEDPNCALKLCRGDLLRSLSLESKGYSSPSEIFFQLAARNESIAAVPVKHLPRVAGTSKLKVLGAAWNIFLFLLYLRLKISLSHKGVLYLSQIQRRPVGDSNE